MARYGVLSEDPNGFILWGAAEEFWKSKNHEIILAGPYETGKTFAMLQKLHALLLKYPKSRGLLVRKTFKDLQSTAMNTYLNKVLLQNPITDPNSPIKAYGGKRPEEFMYPNGSVLIIGGLDNAGKVLSGEYDFIGVNQTEELSLDEWEKLIGRATGRAGNSPYPQVMGDCNPDGPQHWIINRPQLQVFHMRHEDNPRLYSRETGEWTEHGARTISILDSLTGLRYERGRLGKWVAAEGQVYDSFNPSHHVLRGEFSIPADWRRIRSIDFGYTNPFVCLWGAVSPDNVLFIYRQLYQTQILVEDAAKIINRLSEGEHIETTVADHDAEDRATLRKYGIFTQPAYKDVQTGIQYVQERLKLRPPDRKPGLYILENSLSGLDETLKSYHKPTNIVEEFPLYVWDLVKRDETKPKEVPIKEHDHALDALRYMVAYVDAGIMSSAPNPFY